MANLFRRYRDAYVYLMVTRHFMLLQCHRTGRLVCRGKFIDHGFLRLTVR